MAKQLNIEARDRLKKLIPMLASDQDGEKLATVGAIIRTLQANGSDLHDLSTRLSKPQKLTFDDIEIDGEAPTADNIRRLIKYAKRLEDINEKLEEKVDNLEEKIDNLKIELDELEEANESKSVTDIKSMKPLGPKIVEEAFERMGSIIVLLFVLWLFIK